MKSVKDIDTTFEEGSLLLAAIAIITTESRKDQTPDQVLTVIEQLSRDMNANRNQEVEDIDTFINQRSHFTKQQQQQIETFEKNVSRNITILEACIDKKIDRVCIGKRQVSCFLFLKSKRLFKYKFRSNG